MKGLALPDVTDLVLYDLPRNGPALLQMIGRFDRFGRMSQLNIHVLAPETLWKRFGAVSGISRGEFFHYFADRDEGVALELSNCRRLDRAFDLKSLRKFDHGFQPPQFFTRLRRHGSLLSAISGSRDET